MRAILWHRLLSALHPVRQRATQSRNAPVLLAMAGTPLSIEALGTDYPRRGGNVKEDMALRATAYRSI